MYKNILITGCGSGLGESLYKLLISKNYNVVPHFKSTIKNIENQIVGDMNNKETYDNIEKAIIDNDVEVIINNAAVYSNSSLIDLSDEEIKNIINTNLISQILITKRFYKYCKDKNKGLIININSLAGQTESKNESVYCASKFGLRGFSKSLQLDSIGTNIKFRDFYIGAMRTPMSKWRKDYENLLNPDEVAKFICDTFERENEYINPVEYIVRRSHYEKYFCTK